MTISHGRDLHAGTLNAALIWLLRGHEFVFKSMSLGLVFLVSAFGGT